MMDQDSYFDLLEDSKLSSPRPKVASRVAPREMSYESFKKNIQPDDLDSENFNTARKETNESMTNEKKQR